MNKDKEKVTDIIYFKKESDGIEVEVAFQYINEFTENISGFVITFIPRKVEPILQGLSQF